MQPPNMPTPRMTSEYRRGKRLAIEVGTAEWKHWMKNKARENIERQKCAGALPLDCDVEDLAEKLVAWELSGLQGEARARSVRLIREAHERRLAKT